MASRVIRSLCACAAILAATAAEAQSLKSIRARQAEESALAREVAYTSSVCGASISPRIDWGSTASWPDGASLVDACDGALGALEAICRGGKARGGKVSSFTCAGDGAGPSLSGGNLRYGASPGASGYSETKIYLDGAL